MWGKEGVYILDLERTERKGVSCRTDYYNVRFRVLRELLDLCARNVSQPVCLSVSVFLSPRCLSSLPQCLSAGLVSIQARNWRGRKEEGANAQRTSSKLHILLSPDCCWEYLRMPEGSAAATCCGAGADCLIAARGAGLRRRDLELATPVR